MKKTLLILLPLVALLWTGCEEKVIDIDPGLTQKVPVAVARVEADSTVSARVVTLGRHFDSKYEILEGLAEGESVVVKGASTLKSGEKVRLQ